MYNNYLIYKKRLENILDALRTEYMGQNEPLTTYIPGSAAMPPEVLADQIAQQLVIQLTQVTDLDDRELCDSWRWLRAAALFLLDRCPECDHTFGQLLKLAKTASDTLALLDFSVWPAHYSHELANIPRAVKVGLEAVLWSLTKPQISRLDQLNDAVLQLR